MHTVFRFPIYPKYIFQNERCQDNSGRAGGLKKFPVQITLSLR